MISTRAMSRIQALSEGIIEAGWLLALGLVPLLFNIYSNRSYEPDKSALLQSLAIVMVAAWLWKVMCGGRLGRPFSPAADVSAASTTGRSVRDHVRCLFRIPLAPMVAALALVLIVSSALSVDSRLSWFGSYHRAQGAWTQLTYLVVFALALAHLRTHAQWRRVVLTIIVTGASISLYGLFQESGIDPVTTAVTSRRIYSTLGNSIFLGAFLVMVVFLTALELGAAIVEWSRRRSGAGRVGWWPGGRTIVVGAVLTCQLVALVLSQSRGPFLGFLAGAYIFILLGMLRLRTSGEEQNLLGRWAAVARWAVPGIVGAALLTLMLLVVVNAPGPLLENVRNVPYLGRLGSVLDIESRTIQVRLSIWRSVAERLQSDEPLEWPDGTPDPLSGLRPIVGTGPETLGIAVNRFLEPELGQLEAVTKTPDRSHNEFFDLMVMEGAVGTVIWVGLFCAVCSIALRGLGLIRSRAQTVGFWSVLVGGAVLGAAAPWAASGEMALSGVGFSVGLVLSLALFVTVQALIDSAGNESEPGRPMTSRDWLMLTLLATFIAHMVEIQVGIAITTTRLYFWFYAAVVVVLDRGWLCGNHGVTSADEVSTSRGLPRSGEKQAKKATVRLTQKPGESPLQSAWFCSLLAGSLCVPWIYGMTLSSNDARTLGAILVDSWFGSETIPTLMHLSALSWLVLVTVFVGAVLSPATGQSASGRKSLRLGTAVVPAVGMVAAFAVTQAGRVAYVIERTGTPNEVLSDADFVANHFTVLVAWFVVVTLVMGALLGSAYDKRLPRPRRRAVVSAASGVLIAAAAVVAVDRYHIDPVRADGLLRVANHVMKRDRPETGLEILNSAVALSPREPMYQLVRGSAALTAATKTGDLDERGRLFELSETSLRRALQLAPLDPDHSANLARCLARQARFENDRRRKTELLERSSDHYDAAIRLRPKSVVYLNESGRLLLELGRTDEARNRLERAVVLDPLFTDPYIALAAVAERSAAAAWSGGDGSTSIRLLQEAADLYQRVLELQPDDEPARKGLERVRRAIPSVGNSG